MTTPNTNAHGVPPLKLPTPCLAAQQLGYDYDPADFKVCRHCGRTLPKSKFAYRTNSPDGLQPWCKECTAASGRKRRASALIHTPAGDMKLCRVCRTEKPIADFAKHSRSADGYGCVCAACREDAKTAAKDEVVTETLPMGQATEMPDAPKATVPATESQQTHLTLQQDGVMVSAKSVTSANPEVAARNELARYSTRALMDELTDRGVFRQREKLREDAELIDRLRAMGYRGTIERSYKITI